MPTPPALLLALPVLALPALALLLPARNPWTYQTLELQGWSVQVQDELWAEEALREDVLALLRTELWELRTRLPAPVVERLQQVELRFHLDRAECPGGVYHPSARWLVDHDLPAEWAEGVEFGVAENFLTWSRTQPDMVLHELSHAWHHRVLGYDHQGILDAFEEVVASGVLEEVVYITGGTKRAYALTNAQEFFAEMSEAWWGVNDMHPFVRGELLEGLPAVGALMEAAWRLPDAQRR